MHAEIQGLLRFLGAVSQPDCRIADLGSYNLNGGAAECFPRGLTGFDIVAGPGVDIRLTPGEVPENHREAYDVVLCCNTLVCAESLAGLKAEILGLLHPEGWLLLTCCTYKCRVKHTSSPGTQDTLHRPLNAELQQWLRPEFSICCTAKELGGEHSDQLILAQRSSPTSTD